MTLRASKAIDQCVKIPASADIAAACFDQCFALAHNISQGFDPAARTGKPSETTESGPPVVSSLQLPTGQALFNRPVGSEACPYCSPKNLTRLKKGIGFPTPGNNFPNQLANSDELQV